MAALEPNTRPKFEDLREKLGDFFLDDDAAATSIGEVFENVETSEEKFFIASEAIYMLRTFGYTPSKAAKFFEIFEFLKLITSFSLGQGVPAAPILLQMARGDAHWWFDGEKTVNDVRDVVTIAEQLVNLEKVYTRYYPDGHPMLGRLKKIRDMFDPEPQPRAVPRRQGLAALFPPPRPRATMVKSANKEGNYSSASIARALMGTRGDVAAAARLLLQG